MSITFGGVFQCVWCVQSSMLTIELTYRYIKCVVLNQEAKCVKLRTIYKLFQKILIKLHAQLYNLNIQIFSYGSILTFRISGLWNSQLCLSHIFKCISHILAFIQMYLLIFVSLTIRVSQFQEFPVFKFPVSSFLVGHSQFCVSQFHVVTSLALLNFQAISASIYAYFWT